MKKPDWLRTADGSAVAGTTQFSSTQRRLSRHKEATRVLVFVGLSRSALSTIGPAHHQSSDQLGQGGDWREQFKTRLDLEKSEKRKKANLRIIQMDFNQQDDPRAQARPSFHSRRSTADERKKEHN